MEFQSLAPLGKKNVISDTDLLGQVARFLDLDYSATGVKAVQSQQPVYARLVKNTSGGALTPGAIVYPGSELGACRDVGGEAIAGTTLGCGVVDPWLGSVADDDIFWLIYSGPCKFQFTTGTALVIGQPLALGAAGRAKDLPEGSLTDQLLADRCGRADEAVASGTANDVLFRGIADFRI